jgi:hypothetical protein
MVSEHAKNPSKQVTEARAAAQRTELNAQAAERRRTAEQTSKTKRANGKQGQRDLLAKQCLSQSGLLPSIPMFINPARKTPDFSHGDRRAVPFGA